MCREERYQRLCLVRRLPSIFSLSLFRRVRQFLSCVLYHAAFSPVIRSHRSPLSNTDWHQRPPVVAYIHRRSTTMHCSPSPLEHPSYQTAVVIGRATECRLRAALVLAARGDFDRFDEQSPFADLITINRFYLLASGGCAGWSAAASMACFVVRKEISSFGLHPRGHGCTQRGKFVYISRPSRKLGLKTWWQVLSPSFLDDRLMPSIHSFFGRNRFVKTGFRFYPKTGLGFLVEKKWTASIPHINTSVTGAK